MGKIDIYLKPGAKHEKIGITGEDKIAVSVTAPPVEGKANKALIKLFSKKLKIPKSSFKISHGLKSRNKTLEINGIDKKKIFQILKVKG